MARTIDEITSSYLVENGLSDASRNRVMALIVSGCREMKSFSMVSTNQVELEKNHNGTYTIPEDYVDYIAFAVKHGDRCLLLDVCESICSVDGSCFCDSNGKPLDEKERLENDMSSLLVGLTPDYYANYVWDSLFSGGLFTIGTGYKSYGKVSIDSKNGVFKTKIYIPDSAKLFLKYETNGMNGAETIIPDFAEGALKAYVKYMMQPNSFSLKDYTDRFELVKAKSHASSFDELRKSIRSRITLGIRR